MIQATQLRRATPADLDWLVDLRLQTMVTYSEASGRRLSQQDQENRVLQDFDSIRVITASDEDIGMIKVIRNPEQWQLVQIQLLPKYQGMGVGARHVKELIAQAKHAEVSLALSVLKVNPAKRLYERLGFRVVAENERSYEMRMHRQGLFMNPILPFLLAGLWFLGAGYCFVFTTSRALSHYGTKGCVILMLLSLLAGLILQRKRKS